MTGISRWWILCCALVVFLHPRTVSAVACQYTGSNFLWVFANYYENSGGYCPDDHFCAGALYTEADYQQDSGLYRVKVDVYRSLTGELIVSGYTTDWGEILFGSVNVGTTSDSQENTYSWCFWDENITIKVTLREANGKFKVVRDEFGAAYSASFTMPALHVIWYSVYLGSAASPSPHANVYMAAARAWQRMEESGALVSVMNPWIFLGSGPGTYSVPAAEMIIVGTDGYYNLAAAHEMGHIAENELSWEDVCPRPGEYCYLDSSCKHNYDSEEYYAAAYAEGLANFVLASSLWNKNAGSPQLCTASIGGCRYGYAVEMGVGESFCTARERRKELNTTRYLWDLWDSIDDADYDDTVTRTFEEVFADPIGAFPAGFGDHQVNEPFTSAGCGDTPALDSRDATDHRYHFEANTALSVRPQASNNCVN